MNAGGWAIMMVSVGTVSLLFGWCIWKVLKAPGEADYIHGFEIETPDEREQRERNSNQD